MAARRVATAYLLLAALAPQEASAECTREGVKTGLDACRVQYEDANSPEAQGKQDLDMDTVHQQCSALGNWVTCIEDVGASCSTADFMQIAIKNEIDTIQEQALIALGKVTLFCGFAQILQEEAPEWMQKDIESAEVEAMPECPTLVSPPPGFQIGSLGCSDGQLAADEQVFTFEGTTKDGRPYYQGQTNKEAYVYFGKTCEDGKNAWILRTAPEKEDEKECEMDAWLVPQGPESANCDVPKGEQTWLVQCSDTAESVQQQVTLTVVGSQAVVV